jgi:hypothetical protein
MMGNVCDKKLKQREGTGRWGGGHETVKKYEKKADSLGLTWLEGCIQNVQGIISIPRRA